MDKVQFNQQVVGTRKVVKQAKVRVIHQLTRQINKLQKRSGSEEQKEKNKRRAERLGAEIIAIKKFPIDEITKEAIKSKKTYEEVCKNPQVSVRVRAMARLTNYDIIKSKVSPFQDMVEAQFFQMGKKNKRKLQKERAQAKIAKENAEEDDKESSEGSAGDSEANSDSSDEMSKSEDPEDEMTKLEDPKPTHMETLSNTLTKLPKWNSTSETTNENPGKAPKLTKTQETTHKTPGKASKLDNTQETTHENLGKAPKLIKTQETTHENPRKAPKITKKAAVDIDSAPIAKLKKSSFFTSANDDDEVDKDSSGEQTTKADTIAEDFKGFTSELKTNESIKNFLKSRTAEGKKTLDSVFMGSLSDKKSVGMQLKKNRAGQRERQRKGKMQDPTKNKTTAKQPVKQPVVSTKSRYRKVAMVDQPNVKRTSDGEKLVPGINCYRNKMPAGKGSGPTPKPKPIQNTGEKLHPSWEAKRRKKEEESKPVTFEGKKITFDDD